MPKIINEVAAGRPVLFREYTVYCRAWLYPLPASWWRTGAPAHPRKAPELAMCVSLCRIPILASSSIPCKRAFNGALRCTVTQGECWHERHVLYEYGERWSGRRTLGLARLLNILTLFTLYGTDKETLIGGFCISIYISPW